MKRTNEYYIENFINFYKGLRKSQNTIDTYVFNITQFLNNINKNTEDVTKQDITLYLVSGLKNKSTSTVNVVYNALNSYYKTLIQDLGLLDMAIPPTYGVRVPKVKSKHRSAITKEQVYDLINCAKNPRDKAIIMLYFNTGLRVHELIALTLEQYKNRDENNSIILTVTKGSKDRVIYLNDKTIDIIDEYLKTRKNTEYDNLFISNGGKPMDASCIRKTFKTIAKRSDSFTDDEVKGLCNHTLRHTFANELDKNNVSLQTICDAMGHSSVTTTMIYIDTKQKNIMNAMAMVI